MATQGMQGNQQSEESQRGSQRQAPPARRRGYGFVITPGDVFPVTPFSLMRRMAQEMDRVFGEFGLSRGGGEEPAWSPSIDVSERDGNYVIRAELAGVNPEDVKLEITDEAVVLQGERKIEHEEKKGDVHLTERRFGRFYRRIPLPEGAKIEDARANFNNGVLEVTVPVQQQRSQSRQIPIESGSTQHTEKAA